MNHCQRVTGCNALAYEMQLPMKKRTKLKVKDEQMRFRKKKVAHKPKTDAPKIMQSSFIFLLNYYMKITGQEKGGYESVHMMNYF